MSRSQTCTLMISYNGQIRDLTFPENTTYEGFVKFAMDVFQISKELFDSVKISPGVGYVLTKEAFENFLMFNPEPDMILKMYVNEPMKGPEHWRRYTMGTQTTAPRWSRYSIGIKTTSYKPVLKTMKIDLTNFDGTR